MSQNAILIIDDHEYFLNKFTMEISREYDHHGRPATVTRFGKFTFELNTSNHHVLAAWAITPTTTKNGQIKLFQIDSTAVHKTYNFEDAYVMNFLESYDVGNEEQYYHLLIKMTIYANIVELNPGGISYDNGWHS